MRRIHALALFCFLFSSASAQEMWGISNGNYAGNMGIHVNPSTIVGAPYKYELNILAADFFAENTYVYFPAFSGIIFKSVAGNVPKGQVYFDLFNGKPQRAFMHTLVIGPSYINNQDGSMAWGFHTAYRNEISVMDAPAVLSKFIYEKFHYRDGYNQFTMSNPSTASWLSFIELGGTYGKVIRENNWSYMKWAVTGNLLIGLDAMNIDIRKLDYTFNDSARWIVHAMDATVLHALNPTGSTGMFSPRGVGLSTTAGFTYIRKRNPAGYDCNNISDRFRKYKYRFGISLMDFGLIDFFRQSRQLVLHTTQDRVWTGIDTAKFVSAANFDNSFSNHINGVSAVQSKSFSMWLPAAFSMQFDYCLRPRVYANATVVNRLNFSSHEVLRGNQLDLSVRYERKKYEATGDFTLFEYKQPSVGVGFRFYWFVIGTDRLLQWLDLVDIKSLDLFFGFKISSCDPFFKKKKANCPAYGR